MLDHERVPKAGFAALQAACRPVIVVAERPPEQVAAGQALALDVHVVSDLRAELPDARIDSALVWDGGRHDWHWGGAIEPDTCQRVGTMQFVVPDAPGELRVELTLTAADHSTTNTYSATIT